GAEFQLRVGDNNAAFAGVGGGAPVDRQRHLTHLLRQLAANHADHGIEADVFVMIAEFRLRRRRENRLFQLLGLLQPGRQLDTADAARGLVILPAGTDDVTAYDGLDG